MTNYGIISEFNPFHNGHKYLTDKCRQMGASHITAIMSGNFVQRGDCAVLSKHIRTKMALECGVDLVIELPLAYALSSAEVFARGGVYIAGGTGCIDSLAFGSECGSLSLLEGAAKISASPQFKESVKASLATGVSYPTALARAADVIDSGLSGVMSAPNNVLGIEYIKAIRSFGLQIAPVTVAREGDAHNSQSITSEMASASNIRELILSGKSAEKYMPHSAYEILKAAVASGEIASLKQNERGIILQLRQCTAQQLKSIADVSEGLENRIYTAVQSGAGLDEIITAVKTKRYTMARIRRIIISALLGITKDCTAQMPQYIRVLGFNKNGAEILSRMKKTATLPIVIKLTNLPKGISNSAKAMLNLEVRSTSVYNTLTKKIKPCGTEYTDGLVIS